MNNLNNKNIELTRQMDEERENNMNFLENLRNLRLKEFGN